MAGPSLSGPLTGWTSSTLAPRVAPIVPTTSPAQVERAAKRAEADRARIAATKAFEKEAALSGDPAKLREAWGEVYKDTLRLPLDYEGKLEAQSKAAKEFKQRNPTFEFSDPAAQILFEAPTGGVGEFYTEELFNRTGRGIGNWEESKAFHDRGSTPTSAGRVSGGSSSRSSDDENSSLGIDPRMAAKPQTPLESLLASIYPDAAASGGAVGGDPRTAGEAPSVINNILANLGAGGQGSGQSGYVPAPSLIGSNQGAQIASTIPGAPAFLAGAINNVSGQNAYIPAPMAPARGFDLGGLAALSAEQERQKAAQLKAKADADAAWFAQLQAQQAQQQQQDQLNRLRLGGNVSANSWQSPTFKPTGWTPSYPTF